MTERVTQEQIDELLLDAANGVTRAIRDKERMFRHLSALLEYVTGLEEFQHDMFEGNINLADFGLHTVDEGSNVHIYYGVPKEVAH